VTRIILILLLVSVVAWAFWRFVDGIIEAFGGTTKQRRQKKAPMKLAKDPVCGTWVPQGESLALRTGNETHYFCSAECRDSFRKSA
jgi:YHS domain-containing protein